MGELIVILVIVLLVFGASRLPQIGEGVGKAIRNLKRGLNTDEEIEVTPKDKQVTSRTAPPAKDEVSEAEVVERR
jgi:sec-independent protein translocase protein TatA